MNDHVDWKSDFQENKVAKIYSASGWFIATLLTTVPSIALHSSPLSPRDYDGRAFPASRAVGVSILLNDDEEDWDEDRTSDDEDRVSMSVPIDTLPPL